MQIQEKAQVSAKVLRDLVNSYAYEVVTSIYDMSQDPDEPSYVRLRVGEALMRHSSLADKKVDASVEVVDPEQRRSEATKTIMERLDRYRDAALAESEEDP